MFRYLFDRAALWVEQKIFDEGRFIKVSKYLMAYKQIWIILIINFIMFIS